MLKHTLMWSLLLFLLSLVPSSVGSDQDVTLTPVVKTLDGPIVGVVRSQGGTKLNFFTGVPYAKPPVDDLRLQKPQPQDKWTDVLEATQLPPRCMQRRVSLRYIRQETSEDCLYLNIVTPGDSLKKKGAKYPVMISILHLDHSDGSGNDEIYLKAELVKRGNVILVTLNSRLNFFGYAKTEEHDDIEGNMGLWDENFAIRWVKNNIKFFGGDPDMITLRGQGSGGSNVRAHVLSPYARGLFKNAIVEDQGFLLLGEHRLERVESSTKIVLKRIGCSDPKNRLKCVQDADPSDLISAQPRRFDAFTSIIDSNYFSLADYDDAINNANDVNLLMGFSYDSASLALALRVPQVYAKAELTYDDALEVLSGFVESNRVKKIAEIFIGDPDKPLTIQKILDGLVRFFNTIMPYDIYYVADLTARASSLKKGVYTYEFNHVPQTNDWQLCDVDRELGVCYRAAQSFIFGEPYSNYWYHSDEDRKMSNIMMDIYTSFMRTGKPQLPNGKEWPNWNSPKNKDPNVATVIIDAKSGGIIDKYHPQFYLDNLDLVNSSLIPKFHPYDEFDIDTQYAVDKESSYTNFLYNALSSISYIEY